MNYPLNTIGGGIEFDIIFHEKESAFENSHDSENLDKYNLEEQFKTYSKLNINNGIWLDFKNLTQENKYAAKQTLDNLIQKYNIPKNKIWLESGNWQALDIFKHDDYNTSYYLPYYKFEKMSANEISEAKNTTIAAAKSGNISAISFYGDYYNLVKGLDIPSNIVFLSWLDGRKWYNILLERKYHDILNDDRIKVILVSDYGKYTR